MPKKGKGKQGQSSDPVQRGHRAEALPQVWLPNETHTQLDHSSGLDRLVLELDHPPPTEDEQHQMAMFWAMEEANTPRGWDDEEELDYTMVSQRQAVQSGASPDHDKSSPGNPDMFNYAQTSVFSVKYLGHLKNVPSRYGRVENQTDTLEAIDTAQRQGRLPWVTSELDGRVLSLSKYGVKVMDDKKQRVFARHPLHYIANITYYEDTYSKHMVALRLAQLQGQPQAAGSNELVIYECTDETQAKDICLTLAQAFEAVHNKMKFEQNLPRSELR